VYARSSGLGRVAFELSRTYAVPDVSLTRRSLLTPVRPGRDIAVGEPAPVNSSIREFASSIRNTLPVESTSNDEPPVGMSIPSSRPTWSAPLPQAALATRALGWRVAPKAWPPRAISDPPMAKLN
jgi:hypothetical protein